MKRVAALLALALSLALSQAHGELVILKSGKTLEGVVTLREDTHSAEVLIQDGRIELSQDSIEEILTDEEAKEWKREQERLKAESEAIKGTALEVIDKDRPIIRERSLKEIGAQDRRFVLEKLVEAPQFEGNAAEFYRVILDASKFPIGRLSSKSKAGERRWNFNDPIFTQMLKATRIKDCYFYPEHLPYPAGLSPKTARFLTLRQVARGLIAKGRDRIAKGDTEKGLRSMEAALIMGFHLGQSAPVFKQFSTSIRIEVDAGKALAEYYASVNDMGKYKLFNEFVSARQGQLDIMRLSRQDFRHKFKAGKIEALMDYARDGGNDLLRSYVMNYLVLLKLAGEQKPLRKDLLNEIPIESSQAFKMVGPGDSEDIAELFRGIQKEDPNHFLRSHANQLLSMHPFELQRAVRILLGTG